MPLKHWRGNLFYNSDDIADVRDDVTAVQWEQEVLHQLVRVFDTPPNRTGQAVLRAINAKQRKITIVPAEDGDDTAEHPVDGAAGSEKDLPVLQCGTHAGEPDKRGRIGTGAGTDSTIRFTPQDWIGMTAVPGEDADETLLHEMVHALRDARGQARCVAVPVPQVSRRLLRRMPRALRRVHPDFRQEYDDIEEFLAVVITNIYRSERKRPGLRADHVDAQARTKNGELRTLAYPFTVAEQFYGFWSSQLDTLCKQMLRLFIHLGSVPADWNPVRYCVMSVLNLTFPSRPERLKDYEDVLNQYGW